MATEYDLVVIGSGPAGAKGAAQAACAGRHVALVERAPYLGGAGVNTGTLPSKTLRETALYFSGLRQRGLFGIDYSLREGLSVRDFLYRERLLVENERTITQQNLLRHQVELVRGEALLTSPHLVQVRQPDGTLRELATEVILIASGSSPRRPPDIPFAHPRVFDSDEILAELERIPASMAIVGSGVIACEYASIFAALGVQTTLLVPGSSLLSFIDTEIAGRLAQQLQQLGLAIRYNTRLTTVMPADDRVEVLLADGDCVRAEAALIALGRQSNSTGLGLEALGVELGARGVIKVDAHYRTSVPNIYAAGDVIGFPALASTSMDQGRVAMIHAFDLQYRATTSSVIPLAVYTIPEVALVGLTEEQCQQQQLPYLVGRAYYEKNPRGQIIGERSGMLKLLFSPQDKRLLGVHQLGELAAELVHIGAHVMAEGGTIEAFQGAVYNYPSLADLYKYAADDALDQLEAWQAQPRATSAAEQRPGAEPVGSVDQLNANAGSRRTRSAE